MIGFPNLDAVERYMRGQPANTQPVYQTPQTPTPAYQPQANPVTYNQPLQGEVIDFPVTQQTQSLATIVLTDSQFERLLDTIVAQPLLPVVPHKDVPMLLGCTNDAPDGVKPEGNIVDMFGNLTFGTVNRVGKTATTLVNNMLDIVTFGYGKQ